MFFYSFTCAIHFLVLTINFINSVKTAYISVDNLWCSCLLMYFNTLQCRICINNTIFATMTHKIHIVRYIGMAMVSLMLLMVMGLSVTGLQLVGHSCCHSHHLDLSMAGMNNLAMCMDSSDDDCCCHDSECPCSDKDEQSEVVKLDFDTLTEDVVKCLPLFVSIVDSDGVCLICLERCNPHLNTILTPSLHLKPDDWQSVSGVFLI